MQNKITDIIVKKIQNDLIYQIEILKSSAKQLNDFFETNNIEILDDFTKLSEMMKKEEINTYEEILEAFTYALLGKDLRRNIAHFQILKEISEIQHKFRRIVDAVFNLNRKDISLNWIIEINNKITNEIIKLKDLILDENQETIIEIIDYDEKINKIYKELILEIEGVIKTKEFENEDEKIMYRNDLLILLKNYEKVGDHIKYIAELVGFIRTGIYTH